MTTQTIARFAAALLAGISVAASGCGSKPQRDLLPTLPGDGVANLAQPTGDTLPPPVVDPWTDRADLIQAPVPAAPQAVKLPPIERFKLANGLEVIVVKNDRLPVIQMQMAIRAGRAEEPLARLGVAELTANLLPKGTRKRNAITIAKAVDFVGGAVTADAGYEATWVTCSTLAKDHKVCLDLLPEMLMTPSFTEVEIANAKTAMLGDVRQRLDDAGALAGAHIQNFLWGDDHVRGWVLGEQHLEQLSRADLLAWHKTWFVPNNMILAVSGAVNVVRLKADLARVFGPWKKGPVPPRPRYQVPPLTGSRIRLVDKPRQTQTHIRVAQYGVPHDATQDVGQFFASLVWNYALGGGGFSSRLTKVVRSEGGKAYGASSAFDRNLERGAFIASTFTRTAETVGTLDLILGELGKMHDDGPTDEEVGAAIANIAGGYSMRIAGARELASSLITADLHGFSQEYVSNYPLLVGAVTQADAAKAAAAVISTSGIAVVLVGDAAKIAPLLERAGYPFERVQFDAPIGPQIKDAKADAVAAAAGIKVLDAALAAKGGDKVVNLKALRVTSAGTVSGNGKSLPVTFKRLTALPDKMRIDITITSGGQMMIVLARQGSIGWAQIPQTGVQDLPASEQLDLERQQWMDPEWILMRHRAPGATVKLVKGTAKVGTAICDVVYLGTADGRFAATLFIDQTTRMLLQVRHVAEGAKVEERYSDYRAVKGLQIAHQRDTSRPGEETALKVSDVELDPVVDATVFNRPAAATPPSGSTP